MVRQKENCWEKAGKGDHLLSSWAAAHSGAIGECWGGHQALLPHSTNMGKGAASGTLSRDGHPVLGHLGLSSSEEWTPQALGWERGARNRKAIGMVSGGWEEHGGGSHSLSMGPLTTHRLQEADIFAEGSNTATEGQQEHEDTNYNQQDGRVYLQASQGCFWERGRSSF